MQIYCSKGSCETLKFNRIIMNIRYQVLFHSSHEQCTIFCVIPILFQCCVSATSLFSSWWCKSTKTIFNAGIFGPKIYFQTRLQTNHSFSISMHVIISLHTDSPFSKLRAGDKQCMQTVQSHQIHSRVLVMLTAVYSHFINSHFVNSHIVNSHLVNFPLRQFPLSQFPFGQSGNSQSGNWRSGNWRSGKLTKWEGSPFYILLTTVDFFSASVKSNVRRWQNCMVPLGVMKQLSIVSNTRRDWLQGRVDLNSPWGGLPSSGHRANWSKLPCSLPLQQLAI